MTATRQLLGIFGIPADFFLNTMTWIERQLVLKRLIDDSGDARRMFRFAGDTLYGVVSERYSVLDNIVISDILETGAGPELEPAVVRLDPDHTKVRLIPAGSRERDIVPMIEFTNSECGLGSLQVWAGVFRILCSNGLMAPISETRTRFVHRGSGNFQVPDLHTVFNVSGEYVARMEAAKTEYLGAGDKARILNELAGVLTNRVAARVAEVANRDYRGGDTLHNTVNAITHAAQLYPPQQQSAIEQYASRLLAA